MRRKHQFGFTLRRVQGNSMVPTLSPGRIVLAHYTHNVRPGQIVIANHGQLQIIKRVEKVQDGRVYLLGDNPQASTDSRNFGWVDKADIVGVVIWPRGV